MVFFKFVNREITFLRIIHIVFVLFTQFSSPRFIRAEDGNQENEFCPSEEIVDLSEAKINDFGFLAENGLLFPRDSVKVRDGILQGCICDLKPCLAICPPKNISLQEAEDYVIYSAIPKVYTTNLTIDEDEENSSSSVDKRFNIHLWDSCTGRGAYFLDPVDYEGDEFYLLKNGSLFLPKKLKIESRFLDFRGYCLRFKGNSSFYIPRVCSPPETVVEDEFSVVKYIGVIIAVPFIIATIFVYSFLPELKNIHGTTLRCYLSCLLVTHIALAADRIPPPDYDAGPFCLFLGFTIYFSFLASFFWLNVMCVDMWWRLGGFGSLRSSTRHHDDKKFLGYSIYAWGSAIVLTAICIGMEFGPISPDSSLIVPGFRTRLCWFETKTAAALYFFGPIGIMIACNICLFVSTSIKIIQHKNDTQRHLNTGESRRHDENTKWFSLHLKLFILMGISWSTEVISWLWKGPRYVWYITDMVNALQGLLIFIIFVCKKNILHSLKKRYKELKLTKQGCRFISPGNSESPVTASLDESTIKCNVSVLVLEKLPTIINQNQDGIQNSISDETDNRETILR